MGLFRRGDVWWLSFTHKGKQYRRSTETQDKKLAEKIYAKVLTQVAEEKWFDIDEGNRRTFEELADKYEATEFKELKSWRTVQSYLKQLKTFFGPYLLSEITPALIDEFKQMRKKEGVAPATIVRQFNIFKRMFNLAKKRWLWIKEIPVIEGERGADNKRTRYLSFEEYHKLLNCCDSWLKDIVTVAAWTGLRQANVLNLKRTQVNLFAKTITIAGDEMKNKEALTIPIVEPAYVVLKERMATPHIEGHYIFYKENGQPYQKWDIQPAWERANEKAEIVNFRWHDLRHCFASWNRQAGLDLDTLADLMGHKDTRMTRRYAHITPAHLKKAVEQLEKGYGDFITILAQSKKKEVNHSG